MSVAAFEGGRASPPDGSGGEKTRGRGPNRQRCPSCRYDRSGLRPGARCPECGGGPPAPGRLDTSELAASRAMIALGMGVLAWIGLVGFGVPAILLGFGGCALANAAARVQAGQADPEPRVRAMIRAAFALGGSAVVLGIVVFVVLWAVL